MLLIGNWCSASSEYICMFDGKAVPTKLVQPGVLRCYTPGMYIMYTIFIFLPQMCNNTSGQYCKGFYFQGMKICNFLNRAFRMGIIFTKPV